MPRSISSEIFPLPIAVLSRTIYSEYTTEISFCKNLHANMADFAKLVMSVAGIQETVSMRRNARGRA